MRISLVNFVPAEISGGYREYLEQILPRLIRDSDVTALLLVLPGGVKIDYPESGKVEVYQFKRAELLPLRNLKIRRAISRFAPDIVFSPVEKYLFSVPAPFVSMLQNMEPLVAPFPLDTFLERLRKRALKYMTARCMRKADGIIALSEFVEETLVQRFSVASSKIRNIPHGSEPAKFNPFAQPTGFPAGEKFLFTAGSIIPARGIEDLLLALAKLQNDSDYSELKLAIAGSKSSASKQYMKSLESLILKNDMETKVLWLGHLSPPELGWCYENSTLNVFSSRVESFGLCAVDALHFETPIVSTTSQCLPEVLGDSATYYNSGDAEGLSQVIKSLLSTNSGRIDQASRNRTYSWDQIYSRTISFLNDIVQGGGLLQQPTTIEEN